MLCFFLNRIVTQARKKRITLFAACIYTLFITPWKAFLSSQTTLQVYITQCCPLVLKLITKYCSQLPSNCSWRKIIHNFITSPLVIFSNLPNPLIFLAALFCSILASLYHFWDGRFDQNTAFQIKPHHIIFDLFPNNPKLVIFHYSCTLNWHIFDLFTTIPKSFFLGHFSSYMLFFQGASLYAYIKPDLPFCWLVTKFVGIFLEIFSVFIGFLLLPTHTHTTFRNRLKVV